MTARKPKPKPRKASIASARNDAITRSLSDLTATKLHHGIWLQDHENEIHALHQRIEALEARKDLRDKSHDEPVSNAGEAVGQHFRITGEVKRPWWKGWRRG